MKRRYISVIVVEAVIILFLLSGVLTLFILLNKSKPLSTLPVMPTYDPGFVTTTPVSATPIPPIVSPPATATQTALPLFTLNGTAYPTASYYYPISSPTPTLFFAPTLTFTPTPFAPPPVRPTCRNILYPVAAGQQWAYQANARGRSVDLNMSVLSVDGSQGNVLVNVQPPGSTKQVAVQCDGDVIRSFPFMSMDIMLGDSVNSTMTASYVSGVLAPNEAAFLNNNWALAWSSQYRVSGNTAINFSGRQFDVIFDNSPVSLTCQTLGTGDAAFETVTVAAGAFRALKVVCTEQGDVTVNVNGLSASGTATGRSVQWFALNIGLVKMQVEYATMNILGVSFSLVSDNYLELKSYTSAP